MYPLQQTLCVVNTMPYYITDWVSNICDHLLGSIKCSSTTFVYLTSSLRDVFSSAENEVVLPTGIGGGPTNNKYADGMLNVMGGR